MQALSGINQTSIGGIFSPTSVDPAVIAAAQSIDRSLSDAEDEQMQERASDLNDLMSQMQAEAARGTFSRDDAASYQAQQEAQQALSGINQTNIGGIFSPPPSLLQSALNFLDEYGMPSQRGPGFIVSGALGPFAFVPALVSRGAAALGLKAGDFGEFDSDVAGLSTPSWDWRTQEEIDEEIRRSTPPDTVDPDLGDPPQAPPAAAPAYVPSVYQTYAGLGLPSVSPIPPLRMSHSANQPLCCVMAQTDVLSGLSPDKLTEYVRLKEALVQLENKDQCREEFMSFVKTVWPDFVMGKHHQIYAEKLQRIADGSLRRLIVNMPPRHTKSEFASYLFPAFMIGRNPKLKIIQTTHTADLSVRFGRKVRNLVDTSDYRVIFPEVHMRSDSKASGRWDTDAGGEYYAAGIGGAISGRGANLLIIDDPHSEQDAMSATALDAAYEWYISGPRQRLQPGGAIVLVMTRWGNRDLTSRLLKDQSNEKADQWEVVEFPAIFPETNNPLWPEFWNLEELEKVKASLTVSAWSAQWMQNPSAEESAILKREYWRIWEKKKPPECNYILQSYDTAFSKKAKADYSACTTWGVFTDQDEGQGIILLDSWKERLDFPELKKRAYDEYNYWNPDMILIEAKAAGTPLTHELRKIGLPVSNFTPSRGNDKITRAHGAAAVFESGLVWAPEDRFAQELIEECAAFPAGDSDDLVDSATQAILRFRQGGFIRSETDYELESSAWREPRSYY
jgi:predicted phage terminase large subunit-like protein